jgi:hypothetical protein
MMTVGESNARGGISLGVLADNSRDWRFGHGLAGLWSPCFGQSAKGLMTKGVM